MTNQQILSLKMENCDAGKDLTIKEYLRELLLTLWEKKDCFSGKRPFGNSGWEYDVCKPLIRAGVVSGKLDSDGYVDEVDFASADKLILKLIKVIFQ